MNFFIFKFFLVQFCLLGLCLSPLSPSSHLHTSFSLLPILEMSLPFFSSSLSLSLSLSLSSLSLFPLSPYPLCLFPSLLLILSILENYQRQELFKWMFNLNFYPYHDQGSHHGRFPATSHSEKTSSRIPFHKNCIVIVSFLERKKF